MSTIRRIGTWTSFAARPLTEGLAEIEGVYLQHNSPANTAIMLRDGDLDIALISPLEYAKESSNLVIVPDVGLWSEAGGSAITVHFKAGLDDVQTLAVDPNFAAEIILAKILLAEEFDIEPKIIPVAGSLEDMLSRADAALLVGDAGLREPGQFGAALDLIELWTQLTGSPYIHGIWCARDGSLEAQQAEQLLRARREGVEAFPLLAAASASEREFPGFDQEQLINYLEQFSYDLPEEAIDGIKEFHHYAYYHGVLTDIPEINLFEP
jgi:chorismate dehydratase